MNYKNECFYLMDFSLTHNQFLFRSSTVDGNLDLLFEGVFFYQGFLELDKCEIRLGSNEDKTMFKKLSGIAKLQKGQKLYVIDTNQKRFYIGAIKASFQKNKLGSSESSIPIKREGPLSEDNILKIVNLVKEGKSMAVESDDLWTEIK